MNRSPSSANSLRRGSLLLLTLFFVGAYFGMRSLPVESCDFLHSQDTLGDAEGLEYCGPGESNFVDLDKVRFPMRVEVKALGQPVAGAPCQFRLRLHNYREEALTGEDIAVSHTEKLHLLCVDESLEDYQHVHPEEVAPGLFEFTLTPAHGGRYKIFLDFIMMRSGSRVLLQDTFVVDGARPKPDWGGALQAQSGKFSFALKMPSGAIAAGQKQAIELEVLDTTTGKPARFEPVMGAYAHLVAFDSARRGFAHFHPLNQDEELWDASLAGLQFSFNLGEAGAYRLWVQVCLEGRERFIPFNLKVI